MRKISILALLPALVLLSCSGDNSNESERGRGGGPGGENRGSAVEVNELESEDIVDQVRSYGSVRSQDVVQVVPQLNERITAIHVDLGDTVSEGDLLAQLYDATYRDNVRSDEANLRQRRVALERDSTTYQRQRTLYDRGAISSSEYDEARSTYESSRADYESAEASFTQSREDLKKTEVRSPVDGVVIRRHQSRGDLASSGQELFEIASTVGYEVRLYLPMREWRKTSINQQVLLRASGEDDFDAEGVISRRSPEIDRSTGLGEVVVTVTDPGSSIYSGVLVESRVNVDHRQQTVVVPRSALIEQVRTRINPETNAIDIEREYSAFVAVDDTLAERRNVELGIEQGNRVQITSGLQPGDKLIVTGQRGLEDQGRIRITRGDPLEERQGREVEDDERPVPGDRQEVTEESEED